MIIAICFFCSVLVFCLFVISFLHRRLCFLYYFTSTGCVCLREREGTCLCDIEKDSGAGEREFGQEVCLVVFLDFSLLEVWGIYFVWWKGRILFIHFVVACCLLKPQILLQLMVFSLVSFLLCFHFCILLFS